MAKTAWKIPLLFSYALSSRATSCCRESLTKSLANGSLVMAEYVPSLSCATAHRLST